MFRSRFVLVICFLAMATVSCGGGLKILSEEQTEKEFEVTSDHVVIGDIVFNKSQLSSASADDVRIAGFTGFERARSEPWENGIVPIRFRFDASLDRQKWFFEACREWTKSGNIHCVPYSGENNRIDVFSADGCWSEFGSRPGSFDDATNMNLGTGCWDKGTIMHELGHAFGFLHEHQRPDRDKYIKVNLQNVDGQEGNFERIWNGTVLGPYDYKSVMHYENWAFSNSPGLNSIEPLPGTGISISDLGLGKRDGFLTDLDSEMIARIYGPSQIPKVMIHVTLESFDPTSCLWMTEDGRVVQSCVVSINKEVFLGEEVEFFYSGPVGTMTWGGDCVAAADLHNASISLTPTRNLSCSLLVTPATTPIPLPPPPLYPTPTPLSKNSDHLVANEILKPGQNLQSINGRFMLSYQFDGNLVEYDYGTPVWSTRSQGTSTGEVAMQGDGNLVIYDANGLPVWASNTQDYTDARLTLNNDGSLVIYSDEGAAVWNAGL